MPRSSGPKMPSFSSQASKWRTMPCTPTKCGARTQTVVKKFDTAYSRARLESNRDSMFTGAYRAATVRESVPEDFFITVTSACATRVAYALC